MANALSKFTLPEPKYTVTPDHTKTDHYYQVGAPIEERFFSFTGYLGYSGGPKVERIKGWAIRIAAEHARGVLLTEDLTDNPQRAYQVVNEIKRAPKQALAKTAQFGTTLHHFAEHYAAGHKPLMKDYDKEVHPCIRAYKKWWDDSGLVAVAAELRVAIPRLKAAGTMDLLAMNLDGQLELIDFKTSKELWPEVQGQLAACNEGLFDTYGVRADILKAVRFGREDAVVDYKIVSDESAALRYFESLCRLKAAHEGLGAW